MSSACSRIAKWSGALALCAAAIACSPSETHELSVTVRSAIADSVAQATRDFAAAYSKLDPRALDVFLRADGEFRGYYGNNRFDSYQDRRGRPNPFADTRSGVVRIDSMHITVLDHKAAVVAAYAYGVWTDTAGRVERAKEYVTYVWTRELDGWRILHFHPSERPDTVR